MQDPNFQTPLPPSDPSLSRRGIGRAVSLLEGLRGRLLPYPEPPLRGSTLNRLEQALVAAVADTLFPPGGMFPLSGTEAGMLEYFDAYLRRCHGQEGWLLHLLLLAFELGPIAFGPRRAPFSRLSATDRTRFLQEAFKSRIYFRRVAFTSMRALMTMGYLAHPEVADHVGIVNDADPFGLGADGGQAAQEVSP